MGGTVYEGQELGARSLRLSGCLALSGPPSSHSLALPWCPSLQGIQRGHKVRHRPFQLLSTLM